ncbi:peptidase dimerization domain-containing protein [Variovorax sp.]|uniref:peptidase dimerization domain-containing protein n=1 Tax=Variovorax sp. TaxID=1871043 RepID=UPI002D2A9780|nr:peptidase dimerization domain-containing protein [Variovorax sp.]HYP83150.1 peptidase dimerization domain-containing protein [Variovorax sp.]
MKKTIGSFLCVAVLGAIGAPALAQTSGGLVVEFQGPGGHSNGNYGRTSALHAAGRSLILLQKAGLPPGSYTVSALQGGNSVNSIASDGHYEVALTAADPTAYEGLVAQVTAAAKAGADAENAFRGVKEGDLTAGAPATIRYTVTPK